jgi:hypothetical protein
MAGTAVKEKYHDYIVDLANHLGVKFDAEKSKSKLLKIKSLLTGLYSTIEKLESKSIFGEYFTFTTPDNKKYMTDSYIIIPESDIIRVSKDPEVVAKDLSFDGLVARIFNEHRYYNVNTISFEDFINGKR